MVKNPLIALVVLLLSSTGGFTEESARRETIRVSLSIYSGRQDPYWMLSEDASKEEYRQLKELLTQTRSGLKVEKPEPPPHMGYHGFLIERGEFSGGEIPLIPMQEYVKVEDGVVCFAVKVTAMRFEEVTRDDSVEIGECLRRQESFRLAEEEWQKTFRRASREFKENHRRNIERTTPAPCYQETCYKDSINLEDYLCRQSLRRDLGTGFLASCKESTLGKSEN